MNESNNSFLDFLNIVSLVVGLQNLTENREQSEHNDVQRENDKQARHLLKEINQEFEKQNAMLRRILEILEQNA